MREAVDETSTFTLAENQFSDWTQEEYRSILGYRRFESDADIEVQKQEFRSLEALEIPASVDWRNSKAVTNVKDQGQCGSCWSFSTTGTIEGAYAQKYGKLLSFSEQQFVDCSTRNYGCNGGSMTLALLYAKSNAIVLESDYPYVSGTTQTEGACDLTGKTG